MGHLAFVKPLKVILIERFVLIKQSWNYKRKSDDKISSLNTI